ncbi:MAG TPA: sugar ABC transporter substrate-binding protein [Herpetosiphonaceae bacterium]
MHRWLRSMMIGGALVAMVGCGSPTETGGTSGAATTTTGGAAATSAAGGSGAKILLSMKGPGGGNPFWAAVEQGAKDAAAAGGVELTVLAPPAETDVQTQISQIEDQIAAGVQAIVVAPTDQQALNATFDSAKAKNIPVLFVDTDAPWEGKLTFIGTDNRAGGKLAGEHICGQLKGSKKVALITGVMSQQTHIDRIGGAKEALEACGATIVSELPADSDRAKGQQVMEDILTGNGDLEAVFASNDLMALGAAEAAKASGKLANIIIVGFDANPDAAKSIQAGEMNASIAQSPSNMGKFGVESALKAINGQTIEARIDTGTVVVTRDNAADYAK